jgi:hypothetical protein
VSACCDEGIMKLINNHGGGWSVVLGKTILSKCRFVLYSPFGASIYHNITASTNAPQSVSICSRASWLNLNWNIKIINLIIF